MVRPDSVFTWLGHLQNASAKFCCRHCFRYHSYLKAENVQLLCATFFANWTALSIVAAHEEEDAVDDEQILVAPHNTSGSYEAHCTAFPIATSL